MKQQKGGGRGVKLGAKTGDEFKDNFLFVTFCFVPFYYEHLSVVGLNV